MTKISLITRVFDSESVSNANIVPYEVLLSFCSLQFDFPDSRVSQPSQNCQRWQSEGRTTTCTNKNTSIKAQLTAFFHFGPAYGRRKLFDPNWNFSDSLTRNSTYSIHEILPRSISRWCGVTWQQSSHYAASYLLLELPKQKTKNFNLWSREISLGAEDEPM